MAESVKEQVQYLRTTSVVQFGNDSDEAGYKSVRRADLKMLLDAFQAGGWKLVPGIEGDKP